MFIALWQKLFKVYKKSLNTEVFTHLSTNLCRNTQENQNFEISNETTFLKCKLLEWMCLLAQQRGVFQGV